MYVITYRVQIDSGYLWCMANHYNAALEQATADLKSVNAEIQRLLNRKTTLESLVRTLTSLSGTYTPAAEPPHLDYIATGGVGMVPNVGEEAAPSPAELVLAKAGMLPIPMNVDAAAFSYLWKQIAEVMKGTPAFTIAQAGKAVEQATGRSFGSTRSQQVRNSLIRHPEMFRRNDADGTWSVIGEVV